jgi:hypothetical protein
VFKKIPLALNNTICQFIFVKLYITTGEMQEKYSGRGRRQQVTSGGKREEGRGKREEGRGKREEGRGKREEGRGKSDHFVRT